MDYPETPIRLAGVIRESIVDGPGIRLVVFVQGCPHHCPGCHNPDTHDPAGGYISTIGHILEAVDKNPLLAGVTFSGGEPFGQPVPLTELARELHARGLNIVTYTGYTMEHLLGAFAEHPEWEALLREIDILVDGPFILEQKDMLLKFRGSKNQRVLSPPVPWKKGARWKPTGKQQTDGKAFSLLRLFFVLRRPHRQAHCQRADNEAHRVPHQSGGDGMACIFDPHCAKIDCDRIKVVSDDPCITAATLPAKLSGPFSRMIFSIIASDPLPETGRNSHKGMHSSGSPIAWAAGANSPVRASNAPEALSIATAAMSPIREGRMPREVVRPSFAPSTKLSNTRTFLMRATTKMAAIIRGSR